MTDWDISLLISWYNIKHNTKFDSLESMDYTLEELMWEVYGE